MNVKPCILWFAYSFSKFVVYIPPKIDLGISLKPEVNAPRYFIAVIMSCCTCKPCMKNKDLTRLIFCPKWNLLCRPDCVLADYPIYIFLDNGVMTTPKRWILSFVFTVLCLKRSLLILIYLRLLALLKVPINPKLLFCLNKYMYNSEQNGAKIFDLGQNRNFL